MRLYGALSELAELIIRLASGKTVKVSASEQTAAGETVVTIPNVVDGADEFVMKDTQQSLTKKTLSGSVTTDVNTNKTSDTVISNADITANKIIIPNLTNNSDRPNDKQLEGALTLSSDDKVYVGTGLGYKVLVDLDSSETMFNKTLSNPGISGGTVSGAQIGTVGSPASIERISKLQINPGIAGTGNSHVAITNASGELVTEAQLAKSRGGIGADATNITFPASGVLVTEAGSQTLSNKTIGSVSTPANGILTISGTGALQIPAGTTAQKNAIATPVEGMIRYNTDTDSFEGYASNTWSGIGGGGTTDRVPQTAHGFALGDVLWLDPGNPPTIPASYKKAKADAANTAEVVGMVSRVIDVDNFELTLSGEVSGLTGLTAGEVYFLSAATAGALTIIEPSVVGQVSLPVGVASSTTSLYVAPKRGVVVGGANLRTQIGLNGAALVSQTTNIQNVTAYTAGSLAGWVYIDATTDRRFYIQVQFVKDAANAWKCAYQTTGDTPPAGFNVDVIVSGPDAFVQVQMPPVAGFNSATSNINFALNAPAVGATLPLQIDGGLVSGPVLGSTSGAAVPAGRVGEVITQTNTTTSTTTTTANSEITVQNAEITLGVGVWDLQYFADVGVHRTTAGTLGIYGKIKVTEGVANTNEAGMESFFGGSNSVSSTFDIYCSVSKQKQIVITSGTKTYRLRLVCNQTNTVGVAYALSGDATGQLSGNDASTFIRAVRIA